MQHVFRSKLTCICTSTSMCSLSPRALHIPRKSLLVTSRRGPSRISSREQLQMHRACMNDISTTLEWHNFGLSATKKNPTCPGKQQPCQAIPQTGCRRRAVRDINSPSIAIWSHSTCHGACRKACSDVTSSNSK